MAVEWVTFDCYGTLIDWERGITDALLPLAPAGTSRKALAEGYHLYKHILDRVSRRLLEALDVRVPPDVASPLPTSVGDWRPFPEVPAALAELRARGHKLAILSNVDRDLLELSIAQLGIRPDLTVTAQDAGSYKPVSGHWRLFLQKSGALVERTVHVGASQY